VDHLEALLRKELEHEAGPTSTAGRHEVRELVGLIRARRRRRAVATTMVVLMAVIIAAGLGVRQLAARRAVIPATRPTESTEPAGTSWVGILGGASVAPVAGDFADASHGYLLVARCDQTGSHFCQAGLEITADGGSSWTARELPAQPVHLDASQRPGYSAQIYALGPQTVVYDQPTAYINK
jgi:hypothetical protein